MCNINEVGRGTCTTVNTHLAGLHSRYQRMIGVPDVFGIITCMPTSSNMIGHIYITELVYKQKLYVWYSCCCYELRVITLVAENGASTTHKLAELFFPRKLRRLVGTLRDLCGRERVAGGYDGVEAAYAAGRRSSRRVVGDSGENKHQGNGLGTTTSRATGRPDRI